MKKNETKKIKKLQLDKETLRSLDEKNLDKVVGATYVWGTLGHACQSVSFSDY